MRYQDMKACATDVRKRGQSLREATRQNARSRFLDRHKHCRFLLLRAETLEPRQLLSGLWSTGEWLLRIDGLGGTNRAEQIAAANGLLKAAQIQAADVQVVDNVGV